MITLGMTRPIPSSRYSFCPISSRPGLTDHGLCSIIAKTALGNSRRFIELQTPHFANRSESHTCKLPGGIGRIYLPPARAMAHCPVEPASDNYFGLARSDGFAGQSELRLRGGDGSYRWFLASYNSVRDNNGQILRWYVSCTDIEDRKRAEERLSTL
jgi:hypothetical protein